MIQILEDRIAQDDNFIFAAVKGDYGDRILRGGDLFEKEESWFAMVDNRPEDYVYQWLENVNCPVIRVEGALRSPSAARQEPQRRS